MGVPHRHSFRRELTPAHFTRMNIGERYWDASVAAIPDGVPHKNLVVWYVDKLHENIEKGLGLMLYGDNSRGKTYAGSAILKEAVAYGYTALCILADDLKTAAATNRFFDSRVTWMERVIDVDILMIDDIGKEYLSDSGFGELAIENTFRKRSRRMRPTLLTMNLTPMEFKTRYQKSTAAIARESMLGMEVSGPDMRELLAKENLQRYKSGVSK